MSISLVESIEHRPPRLNLRIGGIPTRHSAIFDDLLSFPGHLALGWEKGVLAGIFDATEVDHPTLMAKLTEVCNARHLRPDSLAVAVTVSWHVTLILRYPILNEEFWSFHFNQIARYNGVTDVNWALGEAVIQVKLSTEPNSMVLAQLASLLA